jgi:hypothetical protein
MAAAVQHFGGARGAIELPTKRIENALEALHTGATHHGRTWPNIFGIDEADFPPTTSNADTLTVKNAHGIFILHKDIIDGDGVSVVRSLLNRRLPCKHCRGKSQFELSLSKDVWRDHVLTPTHQKNVKADADSAALQESVHATMSAAAAISDEKGRREFQRHVAAGCFLAHGLSAHKVATMTSPDFMQLFRAVDSFPARTTIRDTSAPRVCSMMEALIRATVKDKVLSILADGGSTKLVNGKSLIGVMFTSPAFTHDLFAGVEVMGHSENGDDIATVVTKLMERYGITQAQVAALGGDNASVNSAAARTLGVSFANCGPHSVALGVQAAVEELHPGVTKFLHEFRGFVNAGGSKLRANDLLQWGISLSMLDIVDTRWGTVVAACIYLVGMQRDYDMVRATRDLRRVGEDGDGGAAEADNDAAAAADEDAPPAPVWPVLSDYLEECVNGGDGARDRLIEWLANSENYLRTQAVATMFSGLSRIYAELQGDASRNNGQLIVELLEGLKVTMQVRFHSGVLVVLVVLVVTNCLPTRCCHVLPCC